MSEQGETFKSKYQQIVEDLKKLDLDFRINDLNEALEVFHDGRWQRLTDTLVSVIKTDLREVGYGRKKKGPLGPVQDAWVKLAHEQRYNPIVDYFRGLEGRYEASPNGPYVLNTFIKFFENPDQMFGRWLFKWMTGAIARIFIGDRNPMLVLVGKQRIGKSTLARWLCPVDRETYFIEQAIKPENKDAVLRLTDTLVWEVPELGATTRRADAEALKAFITLRHVQERPAYGRYPIEKAALCSFIGSVNFDGAGFLNDPTGSTRFLSCELSKIDFLCYSLTSIDELWTEAYWYFQHVPNCWKLSPEEEETQARINTSFEVVSELDETLQLSFEFTENPADFMTTQDIKNHLIANGYSVTGPGGFFRELTRLLHRRGVVKAREAYQPGKPHRQGWAGVKKAGEYEKLFRV